MNGEIVIEVGLKRKKLFGRTIVMPVKIGFSFNMHVWSAMMGEQDLCNLKFDFGDKIFFIKMLYHAAYAYFVKHGGATFSYSEIEMAYKLMAQDDLQKIFDCVTSTVNKEIATKSEFIAMTSKQEKSDSKKKR